jgi:hypothetical protein
VQNVNESSLLKELVGQACSLGGRNQEDCGSRTNWGNKLGDPISKHPTKTHKKGLVE